MKARFYPVLLDFRKSTAFLIFSDLFPVSLLWQQQVDKTEYRLVECKTDVHVVELPRIQFCAPHIACGLARHKTQPFVLRSWRSNCDIEDKLTYILRFRSYRAVNTLRLHYKHRSAKSVDGSFIPLLCG